MRTTCKPDKFGSGENHQGIQVKNNVNKMGKERLNSISESHGDENLKNKECRNRCDFCQKHGRDMFLRDETMIHSMAVLKIGIPDPFTFYIIYPNYARHNVVRRTHSSRKHVRY